jgi:hypothetical protein
VPRCRERPLPRPLRHGRVTVLLLAASGPGPPPGGPPCAARRLARLCGNAGGRPRASAARVLLSRVGTYVRVTFGSAVPNEESGAGRYWSGAVRNTAVTLQCPSLARKLATVAVVMVTHRQRNACFPTAPFSASCGSSRSAAVFTPRTGVPARVVTGISAAALAGGIHAASGAPPRTPFCSPAAARPMVHPLSLWNTPPPYFQGPPS